MKQLLYRVENNIFITAIKYGLVELIPILMIGSFALAFHSVPIPIYQEMITQWCSGILGKFLEQIYLATFGMLSVYVCISVSHQLALMREMEKIETRIVWIFSSLCVFFVLSGIPGESFDSIGPKGLFIAILSVFIASRMFFIVESHIQTREMLARGIDVRMGYAVRLIVPTLVVIVSVVVLNEFVITVTNTESVYELFQKGMGFLFSLVENETLKGILFVLVASVLWFFGIHGSDVLEGVSDQVFLPVAVANGEMINRTFLDSFILMGGCGATICLLLAIFLFNKRNSVRNLGKMGTLPAIFNINEIFVYGLPIIFNVIFLIPFIVVPLLCFATSYLCMKTGLVPVAVNSIEWTTPVILSGYLATGSIRGSLLQIFNIAIGIAVYAPFVKLHEKNEIKNAPRDYEEMKTLLIASEEHKEPIFFAEHSTLGLAAKGLTADLMVAMKKNKLRLYYQPQMDSRGRCVGAEALLRWNHETLGFIYPPLLFKLAEEAGFKKELDHWVVHQALVEAKQMDEMAHMREKRVSVNVTPQSIQDEEFVKFLLEEAEAFNVKQLNFCIEVTEQAAIDVNDEMAQRLERLRNAGYVLAVDDFSMGSTSVKYLTGNSFSEIKIDGYLIRQIASNKRCYDIVARIISMCKTLDTKVVAEYVETEETFEMLKAMGCDLYQGWHFAKAKPMESYINSYGNLRDFVIK